MLEKLGKMAQGAAQVITSEAQKQVSNVKMANLYEDLGRIIYENKDNMEKAAEAAAEIIAKIEDEEAAKEQHTQTSSEAKATIVKEKDALLGKVECPNCGASVSMNMAFCGVCGTEMPKVQEDVMDDEEGKDAEDNKEVEKDKDVEDEK